MYSISKDAEECLQILLFNETVNSAFYLSYVEQKYCEHIHF